VKISPFAAAAAHAVVFVRTTLIGILLFPAAVTGSEAADRLSVSNAWARATPPGSTVGGAYFTIVNHCKQPDTLVAVSSPVADRVELHRTTVENGMSRMRPAGQIVITAGQTMKAGPGGLHVMLLGLKNPLVAGKQVPLVLTFQQAGAITVQVDVQPIGSAAPEGRADH
jgi:copper(I)-binding protein